jgi:hypothetical protein
MHTISESIKYTKVIIGPGNFTSHCNMLCDRSVMTIKFLNRKLLCGRIVKFLTIYRADDALDVRTKQ